MRLVVNTYKAIIEGLYVIQTKSKKELYCKKKLETQLQTHDGSNSTISIKVLCQKIKRVKIKREYKIKREANCITQDYCYKIIKKNQNIYKVYYMST